MCQFYSSQVFEKLNDIDIGLYLESPAYVYELFKSEIIPYAGKDERIRWYQITKIVYEKDVFFTDKMAMLYASLHNVSSVVSLAIKKQLTQ